MNHIGEPRERQITDDGLTTPDLVVLSLLADRPMHGYELNREIGRRAVRDWAEISRPQVYYSLRKLARQQMIRPAEDDGPKQGPLRTVFRTSPSGLKAMVSSLTDERWAVRSRPSPFDTWLSLSRQAGPQALRRILGLRRESVRRELDMHQEAVSGLGPKGVGEHRALLMIGHAIARAELELSWLEEVEDVLVHGREPLGGRHPLRVTRPPGSKPKGPS